MSNIVPIGSIKGWKKRNLGYVYVLMDHLNRVKIGTSLNPEKRIKGIASGAGLYIKKIYISPKGVNYKENEKRLHNKFVRFNCKGEWFENVLFDKVVDSVKALSFAIPSDDEIKQKNIETNKGANAIANLLLSAKKERIAIADIPNIVKFEIELDCIKYLAETLNLSTYQRIQFLEALHERNNVSKRFISSIPTSQMTYQEYYEEHLEKLSCIPELKNKWRKMYEDDPIVKKNFESLFQEVELRQQFNSVNGV